MNPRDLHCLLEENYERFARPDFIESDPIQIPRQFTAKEDIEISAFLTATISWGQRPTIIGNAARLMELMDSQPADFVRNHQPKDRERFKHFVHRTFNGVDAMHFMERMQELYLHHGGLEGALSRSPGDVYTGLAHFHHLFFKGSEQTRTRKHISNPATDSACKRLNMFMRWMVRSNKEGVDFGIWQALKPSSLMMPLDVHTSTVSRALALLSRKQDDWKAVVELTDRLREFDPEDPVKYDYALFGLGVSGRKFPKRSPAQR